MQTLEVYQQLELDKQLGKIQITTAFQSYLKKTLSICLSQQGILQNAGINPAKFFGVGPNGRPNLLQPAYFDPAVIFGPSILQLNTIMPHMEGGSLNQVPSHGMQQASNTQTTQYNSPLFNNTFQGHATPMQNIPSTFFNQPPDSLAKINMDTDGLLNEFIEQRVSESSTKFSVNMREDEEVDTGKKISTGGDLALESLDFRPRPKTKVTCGHTDRNHHAKGLCKKCYETYGKTRKPWKCQHETHFAKGYCKKCYMRVGLYQFSSKVAQVKDNNQEKNAEKKDEDLPTKTSHSTKIETIY